MNVDKRARIATVLILFCALLFVIARRRSASVGSPQDAIYSMLDAARSGDVSRYLASYGGDLAQSLKTAIPESQDFSKYLKQSNASIEGVAIMEPEELSSVEVRARVEYVFQDRNEVQWMVLDKTARGWKIVRVDSTERVKTLVPYGTPVR